MSDTNIPLLSGILPLAILVLIHYLITTLTRKSIKIRRIMSGKPVIVISPKGIEYQAIKDLNMNVDDILEALRQCNYYSLDQVQYAIIETNGKVSVIPTSSSAPATAQDVGVSNPAPEIPHVIISDGKVIKDELKLLKLDNKKLNKLCALLKTEIKDVLILSLDEAGKLYFQEKGKQYKIIQDINKEIKIL